MVSFSSSNADAVSALRSAARPLVTARDFERVVSWIGDASLVLIGESTHGTLEFYEARARLTRLLIESCGFSAVAIEGDWPDAYRVNRYVQSTSPGEDAPHALAGFARFPSWMWRNRTVVEFVAWLRARNAMCDPARRAGFYGLDLYSLHASMRAVIDYLEQHAPEAARSARASYACFDQFGADADTYGWAAAHVEGDRGACEEAATRELMALRESRTAFLRHDGSAAADEFFYAEQNALLARNAERYYRMMFKGRSASWNVRDEHMAETLHALCEHLHTRGQAPKVVVWAHNSHVGDARATEPGDTGELTLGQLIRQSHGTRCKLLGLTTHGGQVIAASDWGGPAERKTVRPALAGSHEALLHEVGLPSYFLALERGTPATEVLARPRLERAIGVVYRPSTERLSHYFNARLSEQFDAILHFDGSQAVQPLDRAHAPSHGELPETFPSGV